MQASYLVSLKGINSGIPSPIPDPKAIPKSIAIKLPSLLSTKKFSKCLSPIPRIYPHTLIAASVFINL